MKPEKKKFKIRIFRYCPEHSSSEGDGYKEYEVEVEKGTTLLDTILKIKEEQDNTISLRYSCRMGVCGSCGMYINGLPSLACQRQVFDIGKHTIEVRPLPNYELIRDVVVNLDRLFEKHKSIKPYIIRKDEKELENPKGEYFQSRENLDWIYQFTYCLKCGLCLSACPTVGTDPAFTAPQALAQAYRYIMDARDEGYDERVKIVDGSHGVFRCHFASSCSQVCPKGVDPALGIQLLKREVLLRKLRLRRKKRGSQTLGKIEGVEKKKDIPSPPHRTV